MRTLKIFLVKLDEKLIKRSAIFRPVCPGTIEISWVKDDLILHGFFDKFSSVNWIFFSKNILLDIYFHNKSPQVIKKHPKVIKIDLKQTLVGPRKEATSHPSAEH